MPSEAMDAYKRAAERGLQVVVLTNEFLGLDLDEPFEKALANTQVMEVLERHGVISARLSLETRSQSGNRHFYLWLTPWAQDRLTPAQRLVFQAALGSDGLKETFGAIRTVVRDTEDPAEPYSVLFETDQEHNRVLAWIERNRQEDLTAREDLRF